MNRKSWVTHSGKSTDDRRDSAGEIIKSEIRGIQRELQLARRQVMILTNMNEERAVEMEEAKREYRELRDRYSEL